jgi:hypothetical protein
VRDRDIVHVGASPLERAQETAAPTAKLLGLDVQTDARLIESTNVFEGKAFGKGDGALTNPKNWWHLRNPLKPSWGEPYDVVVDRMLGAILDARAAKFLAGGMTAGAGSSTHHTTAPADAIITGEVDSAPAPPYAGLLYDGGASSSGSALGLNTAMATSPAVPFAASPSYAGYYPAPPYGGLVYQGDASSSSSTHGLNTAVASPPFLFATAPSYAGYYSAPPYAGLVYHGGAASSGSTTLGLNNAVATSRPVLFTAPPSTAYYSAPPHAGLVYHGGAASSGPALGVNIAREVYPTTTSAPVMLVAPAFPYGNGTPSSSGFAPPAFQYGDGNRAGSSHGHGYSSAPSNGYYAAPSTSRTSFLTLGADSSGHDDFLARSADYFGHAMPMPITSGHDDFLARSADYFGHAMPMPITSARPATEAVHARPPPALRALPLPPPALHQARPPPALNALPVPRPAPPRAALLQAPPRAALLQAPPRPALQHALPPPAFHQAPPPAHHAPRLTRQGDPKTEMCRHWASTGRCRLGRDCRFAHGEAELLQVHRPRNHKTVLCRNVGSCSYGERCRFKHE